jgi:hypothetical protein
MTGGLELSITSPLIERLYSASNRVFTQTPRGVRGEFVQASLVEVSGGTCLLAKYSATLFERVASV